MGKSKPFKLKPLIFIVSLVFLPILAGCWSAHEISHLAIMDSIGIDENENGELEVTSVMVKPSSLFSGLGENGSPNQDAYIIQTVTGKNMVEIMGKLSDSTPEKLYLGHMDVVVFGQKAAQTQLKDCLDYLTRGIDFRPNIRILVANGTAKSVLSNPPGLDLSVGQQVQELVNARRYSMTNMVEDLRQFTKKMDESTEDPYTGLISPISLRSNDEKPVFQKWSASHDEALESDKKLDQKSSGEQNETNSIGLSLEGTAVFKGSRLKGYLNEPETQGLMLLRGKLQNGVVTLDCGDSKKGNVGLLITDSNATYQPKMIDGEPSLTASISVEADIGQTTCQSSPISPLKMDQLNQELEEKMKSEVKDVLNLAQKQWQTDIFGFGEAFYKKDPKVWKLLEPNWRHGLLKNMDVDVQINANINRYGLRKGTIGTNETR
ncbi:Ger(x)C family spore germination protein [Pullulanibacillus sp. KACC 23026]|uniref:Ger(x)C family spore germination protein n=1 Tax=Pullulanibacillus sp. KACC 23026 TaxID=3028315 RepID=UPI0023B19BBA|nr:Ger(x)C family spore germination protein [Pullulanibacillus sp. KACC 23026]WEG14652.1 Ger(x)C family spore germination protein [Pullulanibacillus sp. KACC 23026]